MNLRYEYIINDPGIRVFQSPKDRLLQHLLTPKGEDTPYTYLLLSIYAIHLLRAIFLRKRIALRIVLNLSRDLPIELPEHKKL